MSKYAIPIKQLSTLPEQSRQQQHYRYTTEESAHVFGVNRQEASLDPSTEHGVWRVGGSHGI